MVLLLMKSGRRLFAVLLLVKSVWRLFVALLLMKSGKRLFVVLWLMKYGVLYLRTDDYSFALNLHSSPSSEIGIHIFLLSFEKIIFLHL